MRTRCAERGIGRILALLVGGCGVGLEPLDDSAKDGPDDTGSNGGSTAPTLTDADAYCREAGDGTYWEWTAVVNANDPQGHETIRVPPAGESGNVRVTPVDDHSTELAKYDLSCLTAGSRPAECNAVFREDTNGIICSGQAATYEFGFVVFDEDGNRSDNIWVVGHER